MLCADKDDFWVKECARYSRSNSNQVALAGENFDLAGTREFGQIYRTSVANAGSVEFVGRHRRHLWEQFTWMNEELK